MANATVRTDNTAPIAPSGAGATDGAVWSASPSRMVGWTLPAAQAAPIVAANLTVCRVGGGGCFMPPGITVNDASVALPSPGEYEGSVFLTDEAGNGSATNSATFRLGFDADAPPAPVLGPPIQRDGGNAFDVAVDTSGDPGPAPIARLTGELCPIDGQSGCEPLAPQAATDRVSTSVPRAGSWTLSVRAVDAAGNVGAPATTTLAYTPTEPTPTATATATAEPTPTASPTPTPTGPRAVRLELTRARLGRRVVSVRGVISQSATGPVNLRLSVRGRGKPRRIRVAVTPGSGRFQARLVLPKRYRGIRRARLSVRYGGDVSHRPRTLKRVIRRRAR